VPRVAGARDDDGVALGQNRVVVILTRDLVIYLGFISLNRC
jgi:hypothetical protein